MSWRSLRAKQVFQKLLPWQKELGISRIAELGGFVNLRLSVVQAVRTTLKQGQVSATSGKGWDKYSALCGAFGEALERYCAAFPESDLIQHSPMGVPHYATLATLGYPSDCVVEEWCQALELQKKTICQIPAIEVCFPYYGPDLIRVPVKPHTSGLACGADLQEASLYALFEVVERHISSNFFKQVTRQNCGTLIRQDSVSCPKIIETLQDLSDHGYEYLLFRLNGMLPTYYVAILDTANLGPRFMVAGLMSSFSERQALAGALLEAMQAVVIATQGAREDLSRFKWQYDRQKNGQENTFYGVIQMLKHRNSEIAFRDNDDNLPGTATQALENILYILNSSGFNRVYRCDLSQDRFPLRVVKLIVPGLFDHHVNPKRMPHAFANT